jgi:hypothetical protein
MRSDLAAAVLGLGAVFAIGCRGRDSAGKVEPSATPAPVAAVATPPAPTAPGAAASGAASPDPATDERFRGEPGSGGGGVGGTPRDPPRDLNISLGELTVVGDFDRGVVHRIVRRNRIKLQDCYARQASAALAGTVTAKFEISETGAVSRSSATGVDPALAKCFADVIKAIAFPKPKSGVVAVTYPVLVRPQGS